jgi:hypothetical protein
MVRAAGESEAFVSTNGQLLTGALVRSRKSAAEDMHVFRCLTGQLALFEASNVDDPVADLPGTSQCHIHPHAVQRQ